MNPQDVTPGTSPATPPVAPQPNVGDAPYAVNPTVPMASGTNSHSGHNPYEFIINPATAPKKSVLSGASVAKRILMIVGLVAVVIALVGILLSLFMPKDTASTATVSLAQEQQEILRIADLGARQATDQEVKNLAVNIQFGVGTSHNQLMAYISSKGTPLTVKELGLKQNSSTDKTLEAAKATSTYDSALKKVFVGQLETYATNIQKAYEQTSNKKLKQILDSIFRTTKTLLDQAQTTL